MGCVPVGRLIASILMCLPLAAPADELVGSIGYEGRNGIRGAQGTAEYLRMLGSFGRLEYGVGGAVLLGEGGGHWAGAGGIARLDLGRGFFADVTLMPGLQAEGERDLGGAVEFRSLLGVGREVAPGTRVSVAVSHRSNASLYDENPGVEAISLRYGREF